MNFSRSAHPPRHMQHILIKGKNTVNLHPFPHRRIIPSNFSPKSRTPTQLLFLNPHTTVTQPQSLRRSRHIHPKIKGFEFFFPIPAPFSFLMRFRVGNQMGSSLFVNLTVGHHLSSTQFVPRPLCVEEIFTVNFQCRPLL